MEAPSSPVVAVALDQGSSLSYSIGRELQSALTGFTVDIPALGGNRRGSVLEDQLVPSFQQAELVIVVWSVTDPLWMAFQSGVATGLGKQVIHLASDAASRHVALGAPVSVTVVEDWDEVADRVRTRLGRPSRATPRGFDPAGSLLLCPRETDGDRAALAAMQSVYPDRAYRRLSAKGSKAECSADVMWVITQYGINTKSGDWSNLDPNVGCAFEAGSNLGAAIAAGAAAQLAIARVGDAPPVSALEHLVVAQAPDASKLVELLVPASAQAIPRLTSVELLDVKCFEHITIPLSVDSTLGGAWTCIAGLNGAGKSSILQAIALALLGRRRSPEMGLGRLARMVRRQAGHANSNANAPSTLPPRAEIRLTVTVGAEETVLTLPLTANGPDESRLASLSDLPRMDRLWETLGSTLVVSYGATRNLSDSPSSQQSMSPMVHRQLTLFDSLAQIVSSDALVTGGPRYRAALATLARMLTSVLSEPDVPFECSVDDAGKLRFQRAGAPLESLDLPDGFRSMVALLADISLGWHELHPEDDSPDLTDISGIVLVDELDLHLHASLQRQVVPRLRTALPDIQWIVSTHSPLIVTSFASTELVVLDRSQSTGIKQLDREVIGFSTNEVYDWLLDTPPVSEAGLEKLAADPGSELLYQSPVLNAEKAKQLADIQGELLDKLSSTKA